jgi:RNA polymerase sigma factor (sigma-70 family)
VQPQPESFGRERGREATAEALGWAWQHWSRIEDVRNPVAFLYRVGQSRTRDRRRRVLVERPHVVDPVFEPGLGAALAALPERQRVAVLLVHGAGWTHAEVAELLGVRASTVQSYVERGRQRLRLLLKVGET